MRGYHPEVMRALTLAGTIAALAAFYALISYHAGQGFFDRNGGWYGELAQGFHQGQLSLISEPSPGLRADNDPYHGLHPYPYKWDISYYHGKYYLYFGATSCVLFFYPWLILTGGTLNQALIYWLICVAGLVLYGLILNAAIRLYFPGSPNWLPALLLLLFGLCDGQAYCMHLVRVYELAALTANTCLVAMFYFVFLCLHSVRRQALFLALASFFWAASVGARPNMLLYGLIFPVLLHHLAKERRRFFLPKLYLAFLLPALLIGLLLAWYNSARFGNPLDFGVAYQISNVDLRQPTRVSLAYLPWGLFDIAFMPPQPSFDFPYFFPSPIKLLCFPGHQMGNFAGLVLTFPVLVYGFLWNSLLPPARLRLFAFLTSGSGLVMLLFFASYFSLNYRYFIDFLTPLFLTLAVVLPACEEKWRGRLFPRRLLFGLIAYSLYFGWAFSLIGEINGIHTAQVDPRHPGVYSNWFPDADRAP